MRYWKKFKNDNKIVYGEVEGSELDYLIDRISELYERREQLNEKYYESKMTEYIERLCKVHDWEAD